MKTIKWVVITAVIAWYISTSFNVIEACMMIDRPVSIDSIFLSILGGLAVFKSMINFYQWFNDNLRTSNVKTNENSNNPS